MKKLQLIVLMNFKDIQRRLERMIDIKPEVIEHSTTIRDKFPCNDEILMFFESFVSNFLFSSLDSLNKSIIDVILNFSLLFACTFRCI